MHRLERSQEIPRPVQEVFSFFGDASNLEAITPPFLKFKILTPLPIDMRKGTRIEYSLSLFGFPIRWKTLISDWNVNTSFVDEQISGPYATWIHRHEFEATENGTLMRDTVDYEEPFGVIGQIAHKLFIRHTLNRIFDYRSSAIQKLIG